MRAAQPGIAADNHLPATLLSLNGMMSVDEPNDLSERRLPILFFSREELRMHVDVHRSNGEAKFWIEPKIRLARNYGLKERQLNTALRLIQEHEDEIRTARKEHFRS